MTDEKLDQILKQALAPEINDREIRIDRRRKGKRKKFGKVGKSVAAAAAAIGIGGLGYFNPVLVAKIPLIGEIFEKVEDDAIYSGDYADKATVLANEDPAGNLDTPDYSVSDKGITLTASEVYCDGYSIFLTVNIEAEDADFTHIPEHYTGTDIADNRVATFYDYPAFFFFIVVICKPFPQFITVFAVSKFINSVCLFSKLLAVRIDYTMYTGTNPQERLSVTG